MSRQKTTHIHVRRPSGFSRRLRRCGWGPGKAESNGKITSNSNSNSNSKQQQATASNSKTNGRCRKIGCFATDCCYAAADSTSPAISRSK
jgi:hypothetical protein